MPRLDLARSLVLCLALAGCTDAGRTLVIVQNQVPLSGCTVSAAENAEFRAVGTVDLNTQGGYLFFPLVKNLGESIKDKPSARVVSVRGADVSLSFPEGVDASGLTEPLDTTVRFSGTIMPDGGTAAFSFELVSPAMLRDIRSAGLLSGPDDQFTLLATVTVFGEMDGSTVQSQEFEYPIQVCDGCLQTNVGLCSALDPGFVASAFECTGHLQDIATQCCDDGTGNLVCPATSTSEE